MRPEIKSGRPDFFGFSNRIVIGPFDSMAAFAPETKRRQLLQGLHAVQVSFRAGVACRERYGH